ncbi:MAG: amidohydrolase family protein [Bacillota bacterium]
MKAIINANLYDFYTYRPNSYIVFDKTIAETGSMKDYRPAADREVIDAKGAFLLPGLVIGHAHLYGAFMRGINLPPLNSTTFREQLEQLYWRVDGGLDLDGVYHSAKTLAMDHIRCGVTAIFDHHASGVDTLGSLSALKKAWVDEIGLRGVFCFETSDRFDVDQCIRENVDFYSKGKSEMHGAMFGMHASMSLSDKTLDKVAEAIGDMPVHVHVGESLEDEEQSVNRYGKRIVERFADKGVVNPGSLFAHCVNIDDREADLTRELGATAVLNITSNMNTANGLPDFRLLKRNDVDVVLGNDSLGSNFAADIRNTLFAMHLRTKNPWWFGYDKLLGCVRNSYRFASNALGVRLGRFEAGYQADFALSDYIPPTELTENNIFGHVLDGIWNSYRPHGVWCAGREKMVRYQVQFDEEAICREARKSAAALWKRIGCPL